MQPDRISHILGFIGGTKWKNPQKNLLYISRVKNLHKLGPLMALHVGRRCVPSQYYSSASCIAQIIPGWSSGLYISLPNGTSLWWTGRNCLLPLGKLYHLLLVMRNCILLGPPIDLNPLSSPPPPSHLFNVAIFPPPSPLSMMLEC